MFFAEAKRDLYGNVNKVFKLVGKGALGFELYEAGREIKDAAPEKRGRVAFEQGGKMIGGYVGVRLGVVLAAPLNFLAGPEIGIPAMVAGGAIGAGVGGEYLKRFGGGVYDFSSKMVDEAESYTRKFNND